MKACALFTLLALCCPLTLVAGDFDDGLIDAMIIGSMIGNCAEYGRVCSNGRGCCQYLGYSQMSCRNGQCLQTQCGSYGMRCNAFNHCCYHEGLTCFLANGRCGYNVNSGKK